MTASFLDAIDWSAPWLAPYAGVGRPIASSPDWRSALNHAAQQRQLRNFAGTPIQFVQQASLPAGEPYEAYIGRTGCVPTRDNLHDFFNAMVWLGFPQAKARLNQLQFKQLQSKLTIESGSGAYRVGNSRGVLRDAATIFDENGILFIARDRELVNALIERQWSTVFLAGRDQFGRCYDVLIFGHALLEKLVRPYAAITGHCLPLIDPGFTLPLLAAARSGLDRIAASLLSPTTSTASFFPVPVLGFPGWHPAQDAAFFENEAVFRLASRKKAGQ